MSALFLLKEKAGLSGDIAEKHWGSVERQSCSRERMLKLGLAQRIDSNKGTAVLGLIRGGMRCRQQSPKIDDFTSQTVKIHTLFPLR